MKKTIKITAKWSVLGNLALFALVFFFIFSLSVNTAKADGFTCAGSQMSKSEFNQAFNSGLVRATFTEAYGITYTDITNNTHCNIPVSYISYGVVDNVLEHQTYYDGVNGNVLPHSNLRLSVSVPNCIYQVDTYFGQGPVTPTFDESNSWGLIYGMKYGYATRDSSSGTVTGNFCGSHPHSALTGSCFGNPSTVNVGQSLTWSANASGGNGSYTYSWVGTDGLSGSGSSVPKSYSSSGLKMATVIITSGSQSITRNCSVAVNQNPDQSLTGSCTANPASVNVDGVINWSASASGGNGSYTYSWSGTDGLSGNSASISKSYSNAGTKIGTVTITSGSQSITRNCSSVVNQVVNNSISLSCTSNISNAYVNQNITWLASVSGGNGSYNYSWTGTNGLSGNGQNVSMSYGNSGTKIATVTVTSGNQTASASCSTNVNDNYYYNNNLTVSCNANPSNQIVGSQVNWYASVSGGDGNYDYIWTGADGLNSSNSSPYFTYYNPGSKFANVTVYDGHGQSASRTCYVNISQNNIVLSYSQSYQPPMASAVLLSQVPYTGVADNMSLYIFMGVLALFSAWIAYIVISYQKNNA